MRGHVDVCHSHVWRALLLEPFAHGEAIRLARLAHLVAHSVQIWRRVLRLEKLHQPVKGNAEHQTCRHSQCLCALDRLLLVCIQFCFVGAKELLILTRALLWVPRARRFVTTTTAAATATAAASSASAAVLLRRHEFLSERKGASAKGLQEARSLERGRAARALTGSSLPDSKLKRSPCVNVNM